MLSPYWTIQYSLARRGRFLMIIRRCYDLRTRNVCKKYLCFFSLVFSHIKSTQRSLAWLQVNRKLGITLGETYWRTTPFLPSTVPIAVLEPHFVNMLLHIIHRLSICNILLKVSYCSVKQGGGGAFYVSRNS